MVQAAGESIRRRGIAATSFTDVLQAAGAPRGVIYHHFPGGKEELVQTAVKATGESVALELASLRPEAQSAEAVVRAFAELVRPAVLESVGGAGCAIAAAVTVTVTDFDRGWALAAREALELWRSALVERLVAAQVPSDRAADLASLLLITLEGSHIACRATASIDPFDAAVRELLRSL